MSSHLMVIIFRYDIEKINNYLEHLNVKCQVAKNCLMIEENRVFHELRRYNISNKTVNNIKGKIILYILTRWKESNT